MLFIWYNLTMTFNEHYSKKSLNYAKNLRKNMTVTEQQLWYHLRAKRFLGLKFKRQTPIGNYIVDFLCKEAKLIIELDGSGHIDEQQVKYDYDRDEYLRNLGYKVLRIYNNEFKNIDNVLEYIMVNLPSPSVPPPREGSC